jgi:tetratricopeptide (TPR) repeat protein
MALFVYISNACREDARTHSLSDEIERLKERIESTQSVSHFNPFPPPYLVKKKLGGRQGRLIADLRREGDNAVVVFLAIMIRGDKAYENQFAVDPVAYGAQHFAHLVTADVLAAYVEERCRVEPPPTKSDPNEAEYGFLYDSFAHRQTEGEEDMVYETPEWKEAVSEPRISQQLVRFTHPCLNALSKELGIHRLDIPGKAGWAIWIHRSEGRLLLIVPVTEESTAAAAMVVERYREQLGAGSLNHILRASRRAYPPTCWRMKKPGWRFKRSPWPTWRCLPKNPRCCSAHGRRRALSPCLSTAGRGSGKSTILQYLFADLLYYYLTTSDARSMAPPVYLTANGELLRMARSFVERILRNESAFKATGGANLVEDNREIMDEAFREFQPHLLSMIDPQTRRERFDPANRVDYSKFRRLWNDWFGMDREAVRDFGPDISWHVIRSYIKGMSSETVMDSDDYVQLPENQITVTRETFEKVFERVWEGRYSKLAEAQGLWDDQDLARYVIDQNLARPTHPAVLCDEAQDFTRIELELLLRLNLFSNRSVPPHDLSRVPFVFAGDQFQTLNPTGFRWDAIKRSFVEKFIQALDPAGRSGRAELNYRELRYNYRSTPPIVRFSNGIQALRSALFNMPEMRPQTPWTLSKGAFPVVWFQSDDTSFWKRFKEADTFVVIVPCNEGEEAEFVRSDPVLFQHVRFEDDIPQNILSAARAKGREYPVVVVYGFGDASPKGLMSGLESARDGRADNRDQSLPNEYFINRLYVAVSRPKQRLIIVDSERGMKSLWDFAQSEEAAERVLNLANHGRTTWTVDLEDTASPVVEGMTMGKAEDLTRESAGDPLENAKTFEEDGRTRKDAFLLRQAAMAYRSAGEPGRAAECRARALEIEGAFLDAAQAFADAGLTIPESVRCHWKAGKAGWERLVEAGKQNAAISRETEFKWARAMLENSPTVETFSQLVQELADRLNEPGFGAFLVQEKAWRDGIANLLASIQEGASPTAMEGIVRTIEPLEAAGLSLPERVMAEACFTAGRLQQAVLRWERAGETKSDNYLKAKASIEPYPGKLTSLLKTKAFDDILREYRAHPEVPLTADQWSAVAEAHLKDDAFEEAIDAAWRACDPALLRRSALRSLGAGKTQTALKALNASLVMMVAQEQWEVLAKFAASLEFVPDSSWADAAPRELVDANADALQCILVRALARSDKFPEMPGHLQRQFNEFSRRFLRVKEGRWRGGVTVEEAGAAIERGGKFTESLAFYEAVARDLGFTESEKVFSRHRWIVSKHRQLDHERSLGDQGRKTVDLQRDLQEGMSRMGVKRLSDLPKYPVLEPINTPPVSASGTPAMALAFTAPVEPESGTTSSSALQNKDAAISLQRKKLPDRFQTRIGDISITVSRSVGRCNISHETTMQTAFVNLREKSAGGEKSPTDASAGEWFYEDWSLRITLNGGILTLTFESSGVCLSIEDPVVDSTASP